MDVSVQLALIVAVPPLVSALLLAALQQIFGAMQRRQEWARQDIVAAKLFAQQEVAATRAAEAAIKAAEAVEIAKSTAVKIDGMLTDRDKAHIAEGEKREAARGKEAAEQLAEGQRQGRENERASRNGLATGETPISVADKPTQEATERSAKALERTADAAEQSAKVETEKK